MSPLSDFLTQPTAPWWAAPAALVVGAGIGLASTALSDGRRKRLELDKRREEHVRRWDNVIQPAITRYLLLIASQMEGYENVTNYTREVFGGAAFSDHPTRDALLQGEWRVLSPVHGYQIRARTKTLQARAHAEDAQATVALVEVQVVAPKGIVIKAVNLLNAARAYTDSLISVQDSAALYAEYVAQRVGLIEAARDAFEVDPPLPRRRWFKRRSVASPAGL